MPSRPHATNPLKAWLTEFFFTRGLFKGPNEKPLYGYQVSEQEYLSLKGALRQHFALASHPIHSGNWAACFCLFVAEYFRREYDAQDGGWSWAGPEKRLGHNLSPQQHAAMTSKGLEYWGRPIRQRENGRDWLGSLFAEGGLPWMLVQSETHGFGRAVRKGLKHYYRTEGGRRTTSDLMADCENYLPQTFRNLETRQLLAAIIEQLMSLVEHYPLKDQTDPAAYLDQHNPGWPSDFPIPLDEENARTLINEWLKDAVQRRQERTEALAKARDFSCEHHLHGQLPAWHIRSELLLPTEAVLAIDISLLSSTRLELGFYEGEQLLARGGAVYGQLVDGGLKVRFPNTQITLARKNIAEPVSLRLLENGRQVHVFHFDDSALDIDEQPLIFESRSDTWYLVASASCALTASSVRIRLPQGAVVESGTATELAREASGAYWIEASQDLGIRKVDECYQIELNQSVDAASKPCLVGTYALFDSNPSSIFIGWPRLELPAEYPYRQDQLLQLANGQSVSGMRSANSAGVMRYCIRSAHGKTLLHRRFGVLPDGFTLSLFPAINNQPARMLVRNGQALQLQIRNSDLTTRDGESDQGRLIYLHAKGEEPPANFTLEISSDSSIEPVQLRLPYPYQGARLIGRDEKPSSNRELILDELLGMRIALSSGLTQGQDFHLQLELISQAKPNPKRHYVIHVGQTPLLLNLFSYQSDMLQMLGAVNEQDAYIQLTLETEQRLLRLNVRRYNGRIQWEGRTMFSITAIASTGILSDAKVEAMLLPDPKRAPVQVSERTSEGVGTGWFVPANAMQNDGPWLLYPGKDSAVQFRPQLYIPSTTIADSSGDVHSLHRATQLFHPQHAPRVIDEQIAIMASDFNHSGWQYLADIKKNFSHLPLSSFESWLSLSRNPSALAAAVFRLEMDEAFCGRIRDELAVIWECLPLPLWVSTYADFRGWLTQLGLPGAMIESLESNRKTVLRSVVSGFDYLGDYLSTGDKRSLTKAPVEYVLPDWYQHLRRNHESNQKWPTELGHELSHWADKQDLPRLVTALSLIEFSDAVTYLPIFMAYVTAGKATLSVLPGDVAYLKFAIRMLSDFDRQGWYTCVHAMMVSYLLASSDDA